MGVVVPFSFLAGVAVGMIIMYLYCKDASNKPTKKK